MRGSCSVAVQRMQRGDGVKDDRVMLKILLRSDGEDAQRENLATVSIEQVGRGE